MQIILAFTSLWSLPTAALLSERDQLLGDLSLANSQLKVDSERKTDLVIGLRRHLSIAEEKERLRLSYELHDQAGQGLIAAILEMNAIDALIAGPAHERLNVVRKRMEELGKTLHRIAWELRPPAIDELGLKKALASYVADWSEQCGTEVDFHCDDPNIDEVPGEIGTAGLSRRAGRTYQHRQARAAALRRQRRHRSRRRNIAGDYRGQRLRFRRRSDNR